MSPSFVQIIILGLIQGAAELLPVSSSAHVIIAEKLMRLDPSSPEMAFLLVMLHTGTMAAVVLYFWKAWKGSFFASKAQFRDAGFRVVLATAVTGVVALVLKSLIETVYFRGQPKAEVEQLFSNLPLMAFSLAAAGVLILVAGIRAKSSVPADTAVSAIPEPTALWIGVVQGIALPFRGFSRSGATISTGLLRGAGRRASEEFSFALAVVLTPAVIVQEAIRFYRAKAAHGGHAAVGSMATPALLGMACSFVAGLLALRLLSGWLERGRWHHFGVYCLAVAAVVLELSRMGY
jgi:undecaprenyl-diphosphatase